jgi:hypothetical protein
VRREVSNLAKAEALVGISIALQNAVEFRFQNRLAVCFFRFRERSGIAVTIQRNHGNLKDDGECEPGLPVRESAGGNDKVPGPSKVGSESPGSQDKGSEDSGLQKYRNSSRQTPNLRLALLYSSSSTQAYSDVHFDRIQILV